MWGQDQAQLSPRTSQETAPRGGSRLTKGLVIRGEITGQEDLFVDSEMEGSIRLDNTHVTIGPHALLQAHVSARAVAILGRIKGSIEVSDRAEIRASASVEGSLVSASVSIEEGAEFRGSIDVVRPQDEKLAASPKRTAGRVSSPSQAARTA